MNIKGTAPQLVKHIAYIFLALFLFLFSIDLLTSGLSSSGRNFVQSILDITTNPFVSLFIGLLVTAIIQSSSTTTSMIVAMVASGSLDMQRAIPMVMGANIGTTLTSTLVSLSFITKKQEFTKAFAGATIHDIFNILTTLILFPLQYKYDFLGKLALRITNILPIREAVHDGTVHSIAQTKNMIITDLLVDWVDNSWIIIIGSVILLIYSIRLLTSLIYNNFFVPVRSRLDSLVFNKPAKSFGWGLFLTASWQSSSIATSIIVPLVATSKVSLKQAYPFIVGANIGTTITAFLAAIFNAPTRTQYCHCSSAFQRFWWGSLFVGSRIEACSDATFRDTRERVLPQMVRKYSLYYSHFFSATLCLYLSYKIDSYRVKCVNFSQIARYLLFK
ncbi:MAG: Na/Pi symporter [Cyclobacteriaceae bacterium]|nr:Na/Pi symporter [Cyclobacteriaceae bacterium]